jgi:hypothetical protein
VESDTIWVLVYNCEVISQLDGWKSWRDVLDFQGSKSPSTPEVETHSIFVQNMMIYSSFESAQEGASKLEARFLISMVVVEILIN